MRFLWTRIRAGVDFARADAQLLSTQGTPHSQNGSTGPDRYRRLAQTGLEVVIRYPIEFATASEIDDRVTRELLHSLEQPSKLKIVGTAIAHIQPVTKKKRSLIETG